FTVDRARLQVELTVAHGARLGDRALQKHSPDTAPTIVGVHKELGKVCQAIALFADHHGANGPAIQAGDQLHAAWIGGRTERDDVRIQSIRLGRDSVRAQRGKHELTHDRAILRPGTANLDGLACHALYQSRRSTKTSI